MATVFTTFAVLKDHVKLKISQDSVAVDNLVFKLHYRATFLALLVSSLLVSSRQFIGEHIRCIADSAIPPQVIETYCFFTSTFTVPIGLTVAEQTLSPFLASIIVSVITPVTILTVKHMNLTAADSGALPHPGVGPSTSEDEIVHHAYYQWVPFVLFFQAILFYLPHYFWRTKEGGRLKALVAGLRLASLSIRDDDLKVNDKLTIPSRQNHEKKLMVIRNAFLNRLHANRPWSVYLTLCEILNFINVLAQIYITDKFLGGAFLGLGQSVTEANFDGKVDALDIVFPKVTKCIFHKYGPSGSIQKHDALCVMALNVVNEKIYTFLWFWLIILAIITGLGLVWRILTMVLHARSKKFNQYVFAMACPGQSNPWNVLSVTREYNFNDWLFLYYIAKNLDNYVFKELFEKLAEDLEDRRNETYMRTPPAIPQSEKETTELLPIYEDEHKLA